MCEESVSIGPPLLNQCGLTPDYYLPTIFKCNMCIYVHICHVSLVFLFFFKKNCDYDR
jgi:hypothetical protein